MTARRATRSLVAAVAAASVAAVLAPAGAGAATTIGELGNAIAGCGTNVTYVHSTSAGDRYAAPFAGVVTSWSFQAPPSAPQLRLRMARPLGGGAFLIVGQSALQAFVPSNVNTFAVRIPVEAGDVIGAYSSSNQICLVGSADTTVQLVSGDVQPGSSAQFGPPSGVRLPITAVLEPDCDSDGLGDESQDQVLTACPPPPDTQITVRPDDKTKDRQAIFAFTSDDAGATFECSLDGAAFAACSSPLILRVKKGGHTLQVRSLDAGGNFDDSPATDDWKVKRKRKKK